MPFPPGFKEIAFGYLDRLNSYYIEPVSSELPLTDRVTAEEFNSKIMATLELDERRFEVSKKDPNTGYSGKIVIVSRVDGAYTGGFSVRSDQRLIDNQFFSQIPYTDMVVKLRNYMLSKIPEHFP